MKTYYIEYKKYTDSKWATYTTTATSSTEAYNNIYRDLGNVYAVRLKDVISQDEMEDRNQHEVIPPIVFIVLFIILMHFVFR
uniref:Uncharacterized protein n=1 Tax=Podoviridae sp. ct9A73 TaxID=2825225 RepID=A0A8S5UK01_9CAUD|nr:MAG TPA: hypothetical protein [Podoviridae sp. ct9A73]